MKLIDKCFNKVKKNCLKFIKSQETKVDKFKNKERMIKSFLIPLCFWISKKADKKRPYIVGLAGGQGTGKTTISSLIKIILTKYFELKVFKMGRGIAWLDMGDPERLNAASNFVRSVQINQGFLISCLEEIALNNKWIKSNELKKNIDKLKLSTNYYKYIKKLISDKKFK